MRQSRYTILKSLQILKARINSCDHHKSAEIIKLDEVPEDEFNCLEYHNEMIGKAEKYENTLKRQSIKTHKSLSSMRYITKNPNNHTSKQVDQLQMKLYCELTI